MDNGFSVVTSTKRPWEIKNIVDNYDRQSFKQKQLIVIIHHNKSYKHKIEAQYSKREDIIVEQLPENISLGNCLNYGYSKARYKYIAKFDDDDYYGPHYLQEMYDTFLTNDCDIVCKASIFYYLLSEKKLVLIPYLIKENSAARRGSGATICITQEVFRKMQYSDLRRGVDIDFFIRARKLELSIFSTTSYNFLCIRSEDEMKHTWQIAAKSLESKGDKVFGVKEMELEDACKFVSNDE